jgi:hypothetical protein
MLTIDKAQVDKIIDGLLGNNDLTASPEVWYRLHQIKELPVTEIVRCGECERSEVGGCELYCMEWMRYTSYDGYCHRGMKRRIE